jgi:hypothetical protein
MYLLAAKDRNFPIVRLIRIAAVTNLHSPQSPQSPSRLKSSVRVLNMSALITKRLVNGSTGKGRVALM